jgi:hypothetical protein
MCLVYLKCELGMQNVTMSTLSTLTRFFYTSPKCDLVLFGPLYNVTVYTTRFFYTSPCLLPHLLCLAMSQWGTYVVYLHTDSITFYQSAIVKKTKNVFLLLLSTVDEVVIPHVFIHNTTQHKPSKVSKG